MTNSAAIQAIYRGISSVLLLPMFRPQRLCSRAKWASGGAGVVLSADRIRARRRLPSITTKKAMATR